MAWFAAILLVLRYAILKTVTIGVVASVLTASYASNTSQYIDWRRTDVEKATDPSMIMKPVQVYSAKEQSDDLFQRTKTKGKWSKIQIF